MQAKTWRGRSLGWHAPGAWVGWSDQLASAIAVLTVVLVFFNPLIWAASGPSDLPEAADRAGEAQPRSASRSHREIYLAGYAGAPFYYRSDVRMTRVGGTDINLKQLGWDGDALYFPIDGGIRSVEWWGSFGFMLDFLHNKAIARLGRGAHGRKLSNPIVEEVEATGSLDGKPIAGRVKLTDLFERLEFTHGHNMLFFTGMIRPSGLTPRVRPYYGVGAGFAVPHVEVWFPGGKREDRTNEYQYAGPAAQFVAGLEFRTGKVSYFLEYKFSWARISGALTGDESWKNFNMPGDLLRQLLRWWRGEAPKFGRLETTLSAHQVVGGAGYWWQARRAGP